MNNELQLLMARYFKCKISDITLQKTLKSLGAVDWQIIEMSMEFELMFKIRMDADKALSLKKVSDWNSLIR
jgi:hypothetical protein